MKALAVRNGLWNAGATVVASLAGVVGSILIVRSLTLEAYGAFSYYLWLAGILAAAGTLALPNSLTKITSELRGQRQMGEAGALSQSIALGLFALNALIAIGTVVWAIASPAAQQVYLLIIAAILVPNALVAVFRSTLWGSERYRPVSIASTGSSLLRLVLVCIAYLAQWDAPGFVAAVLATSITEGMTLGWILSRTASSVGVPFAMRLPGKETIKRYLAFAVPAMLSLPLAVIVWERSEVFFLERFSSLEQVGFYSLGFTIFDMFLALGWALINGFYPAISKDYGARDWLRIRTKARQGLLLAILYALPLTFGGLATLDHLIGLLYGSKMAPAVPVAQVLFAGLLPGVVTGVLGVTLIAVGRIWLSAGVGTGISIVNIVMNIILIPRFGALGGAMANTSTQLIYTAVLFAAMYRMYGIRVPIRTLIEVAGVSAVTTFLLPRAIQLLLPEAWGLAGAVIVSGCLYLAIAWRLGFVEPLTTVEVEAVH